MLDLDLQHLPTACPWMSFSLLLELRLSSVHALGFSDKFTRAQNGRNNLSWLVYVCAGSNAQHAYGQRRHQDGDVLGWGLAESLGKKGAHQSLNLPKAQTSHIKW